jgi:hypothetical protein
MDTVNDDSMETTLLICDSSGSANQPVGTIEAQLEEKNQQLQCLKRSYDVLFRTNNGLKEQLRHIVERYDARQSALDEEERGRLAEAAEMRRRLQTEEARLALLVSCRSASRRPTSDILGCQLWSMGNPGTSFTFAAK